MSRYSLPGDRKRSPISAISRVIIELAVIVIGIYLAFQLENWNEKKKEIALEKKYLEQLLEETRINQDELKADQDARKTQLALMKKLLATANRPVAADTLRDGIDQLLMIRLYSPTDAVYQDLTSSGNLGLIKSETIKRILLNYRRSLARVPLTEQSDLRFIQEQLEPYLLEKQVLSLLEPHENLDEIDISEKQVDQIVRVLLRDRRFLDLVYLRAHKIRDVIYFENPMEWLLRQMAEEIEKELANFEN